MSDNPNTDAERLRERFTKLASMMSQIETAYSTMSSPPNDPGYAERQAAGSAVTEVLKFFREFGVERHPLIRLEEALTGVAHGKQPAAMLRPPPIKNRRGDRLGLQATKAELAAIMEIQQQHGMQREQAAKWVADNISPDLQRKLSSKPITWRAVAGWHERYGGDHGEPGFPRECYLGLLGAANTLNEAGSALNNRLLAAMNEMPRLLARGMESK